MSQQLAKKTIVDLPETEHVTDPWKLRRRSFLGLVA